MKVFEQNLIFNIKTAAILTTVCVLLSVFIPTNTNGASLITGTIRNSTELSIDKLVRNVTRGSGYNYWTNWLNTIYVEPGDELEFLIKIKAPRDKEIDSIRISDDLPPKLTYISDSTTVDGYYEPDGIISKNIYIGDAYSYLGREIRFKVKVAPASRFKSYPITIVNKAYAWGSDGNKIEDTAKIIIREPNSIPTTGSTAGTRSGKSWDDGLIKGNYIYSTTEETDKTGEENGEDKTEEVLGAEDVQVGFNLVGLLFLSIVSFLIAFMLYCRIREDKLLEILNKDGKSFRKILAKLYFRLKFSWTVTKARFK